MIFIMSRLLSWSLGVRIKVFSIPFAMIHAECVLALHVPVGINRLVDGVGGIGELAS